MGEEERGRGRERKEIGASSKSERSKIEDETEARGEKEQERKGERLSGSWWCWGRRQEGRTWQNSRRHVRGACARALCASLDQSEDPGRGTMGAPRTPSSCGGWAGSHSGAGNRRKWQTCFGDRK